jgi:HK97 family phage prohead protease
VPWHVAKSDQCPASKPWAVIKDDDGAVEGCHATKDDANDQLAALNASEDDSRLADRQAVAAVAHGQVEKRTLPIDGVEWRESGAGEGQMTVRGHASVYDRMSLDLGGFREKIAKGAFTKALDRNPDVHALWDHDTKFVLARTKNKTLELREDPVGLHFWARVADTSYAKDLRVLMERGDVDQASFAFTVEREEWEIDEDENVTRTILEVADLYDVTVTASGAYPQTDTSLVRNLRSRMKSAIDAGELPAEAERSLQDAEKEIAAPEVPAGESVPPEKGSDERPSAAQPDDAADAEARKQALADLRAETRAELEQAQRNQREIQRRKYQLTSRKETP